MPLPSLAIFILAAISAAVSATFIDSCNNACVSGQGTGKFCGIDGNCHALSCAEVYQNQYFWPPNLAESDTETEKNLTCKDIDNTTTGPDELVFPSVSYRCKGNTIPPPIEHGFNRKCTVDGPAFEFTCYELSEGTGFQKFQDEVKRSVDIDGMKCTDDEAPFYEYQITFKNIRRSRTGIREATGYQSVFNNTAEFNETRATTGTLHFLILTKERLTVAPTTAPTPTTATSSSSHNSIAASKNWLTMFVVVWLHFSVMYSLLF